jgi:hypothetical protein
MDRRSGEVGCAILDTQATCENQPHDAQRSANEREAYSDAHAQRNAEVHGRGIQASMK